MFNEYDDYLELPWGKCDKCEKEERKDDHKEKCCHKEHCEDRCERKCEEKWFCKCYRKD